VQDAVWRIGVDPMDTAVAVMATRHIWRIATVLEPQTGSRVKLAVAVPGVIGALDRAGIPVGHGGRVAILGAPLLEVETIVARPMPKLRLCCIDLP
jgi:hypothetical protein